MIRVLLHGGVLESFLLTIVQEPLGFLLSASLYFLYQRFAIGDPFRLRTAVWVIGLSLLATIIQTSAAHILTHVHGWSYPGWTIREQWFFRIIFVWLIYMVWSLTFFAFRSKLSAMKESARAHQALEEKQRMELQLLRAQLDPHFLFNSLNSVAAEIKPHPHAALQIVRELSDYLRFSLEQRHSVITPLSSELDAVTAYLRIEEARFGDRVQATVTADQEARRRAIPSFLLQPLVENAVKHGLHQCSEAWQLRINASAENELLIIEIENSGSIRPGDPAHEGVGLETLKRRLELHYPNRHRFVLEEHDGKVIARLELMEAPCYV